jgi:hypothetical protein
MPTVWGLIRQFFEDLRGWWNGYARVEEEPEQEQEQEQEQVVMFVDDADGDEEGRQRERLQRIDDAGRWPNTLRDYVRRAVRAIFGVPNTWG